MRLCGSEAIHTATMPVVPFKEPSPSRALKSTRGKHYGACTPIITKIDQTRARLSRTCSAA